MSRYLDGDGNIKCSTCHNQHNTDYGSAYLRVSNEGDAMCISIIHLAVIGLDVIGFFVVIRVLTLRWLARPLLALDRVGEPITDLLIESVGRAVPTNWVDRGKRRTHFTAAMTLLVLALCRLALTGLLA